MCLYFQAESEYGSGKRSDSFTLNMTNPGASFEITLSDRRTTESKTTIKEREMISTFYWCVDDVDSLYPQIRSIWGLYWIHAVGPLVGPSVDFFCEHCFSENI